MIPPITDIIAELQSLLKGDLEKKNEKKKEILSGGQVLPQAGNSRFLGLTFQKSENQGEGHECLYNILIPVE